MPNKSLFSYDIYNLKRLIYKRDTILLYSWLPVTNKFSSSWQCNLSHFFSAHLMHNSTFMQSLEIWSIGEVGSRGLNFSLDSATNILGDQRQVTLLLCAQEDKLISNAPSNSRNLGYSFSWFYSKWHFCLSLLTIVTFSWLICLKWWIVLSQPTALVPHPPCKEKLSGPIEENKRQRRCSFL